LASFNKPSDLPVDQVKALRARGFDNNQIVQALQRNGYTSTQIFDALNQADLAAGNPPMAEEPYQQQSYSPPGMPGPAPPQAYAQGGGGGDVSAEEIEELVESIVEEKWAELSKDIQKLVEWKNDTESKLIKLDQRLESIKDDFDKLHQAIIGKIGEYDKNILAVGAEIKAMEKVFSKVLPVFTENVNELSRITDVFKKKA
jgi:DNA-binding transcriptional MerR regulator